MGRVDVRAAADATPATLTISEIELLRADCERLLYEVASLRPVVEAADVLLAKLQRVFASSAYLGQVASARVHGYVYDGENVVGEMVALGTAIEATR